MKENKTCRTFNSFSSFKLLLCDTVWYITQRIDISCFAVVPAKYSCSME